MKNVTLPQGITLIGQAAFHWCSSLQSIVLPNSVKEIQESAFSYCESLCSVQLSEELTGIGKSAFASCPIKEIVIPNHVQIIMEQAFVNCTSLESIILSEELITIRGQAFQNCSSLKSVVIPDKATSIEGNAFLDCSSLSKVVIGSGMEYISKDAFKNCPLNELYCAATTPPCTYASNWIPFTEDQFAWTDLYVPIGCKETYAQASNHSRWNGSSTQWYYQGFWSRFISINEYDPTTKIQHLEMKNVKVTIDGLYLSITNAEDNEQVRIYSLDGREIAAGCPQQGKITLLVPNHKLYIVRVGSQCMKVRVR